MKLCWWGKEKEKLRGIKFIQIILILRELTRLYDYILKQKPRRIIFNPGTENPEFEALAEIEGIETEEACTLVLLSIGQF
jgi:CoA binding domain